ncbi:hypothetical protein PENTCL1PPCAC_11923 [Pristionchus entomophagus]|uniref:Lon protease homolog n=1 Tax=Pristionchus entomophagus TaxID=358040 RepID=A0AAV5T379_9BILA|nr:hypothetical protein PENTCL1PPCAC_11923 [Pristionchus entomophagus]
MEKGMELPVLLITQGVLLPEAKIKVPIRSKNNLAMLDRFVLNRSIASKTLILVAYRTESEKKVYDVGTVAMIEQVSCFTSSTFTQYTLHIVGVSRAKILDYALPVSRVKQIYSTGEVSEEKEKELYEVVRQFERSLNREESATLSNAMRHMIPERHVDEVVDLVASFIPRLGYERQLEFLATVDVPTRVDAVIEWCKKHLESNPPRAIRSASLPRGIAIHDLRGNGKGRGRIIHNSHEETQNPMEKLAAKLEAANLPDDVRERVFEDLNRVKSSGGNGQESSMLLNYLEFVADLPWSTTTKDDVDIKKARQLLDDSHEGMEHVKKRVLEYMAVRSLRDDGTGKAMAGPILCFAGPPGVGKTSVARAIAQSLGRKFERISLGGIRDEADIRGHRRTYIGAMPGRLLQAIRRSKTRNPVILLDEVDKLFSGVHGSPSAALLEVLDPEQNGAFMDHYLNLPFDLSQVIFIATANDLSTIDGPLSDRLEIIEMSGYSTPEKIRIAEKHVIPSQLETHGVCPDYIRLPPDGLQHLVSGYTREAGVRQLARQIASLCRHAALSIAEAVNQNCEKADTLPDFSLPIVYDREKIGDVLGPATFGDRSLDLVDRLRAGFRPGMVFGLAWTPYGGELMLIEGVASTSKAANGKGRVMMTGKLGEVLKESVDVARSWINANAERLGVDSLLGKDIHVHLPAGAVGKDGPSAGCALVTSLFSLASRRLVRSDTALTGEISLTGMVLPVGGIKEKVLGAHRAGIRRLLLPEANRQDAAQIEQSIKDELELHFVRDLDEVLKKMMTPSSFVLSKL